MTKEFYTKPDDALRRRKLIEYKKTYINVYFPENKNVKILDLGCGPGLFLEACKNSGYCNCEGVEMLDKLVDYARNEIKLSNIKKADVFDYLKIAEQPTYDIVAAFNLLEHIKKEKIGELLDLIFGSLKKGGLFLSEVPNADSPLGIHTFYSDITHEFAYTGGLMKKMLGLSGFSDISVLPNRVRKNPFIRLAQKILAKAVGFDDKIMFSGNIICIARKKN